MRDREGLSGKRQIMSLGKLAERVRGVRDRFCFWVLFRLRRIVSFALAFLGFFVVFASPNGDLLIRGLGWIVGLGGLIASLFEIREIVSDRRRTRLDAYGRDLFQKIHEKLPATVYKNWIYLENRHAPVPEAVIYSDALSARLDKMTNTFRERESRFTIRHANLRHYCPIIRRQIGGRTNEKKLRLCTELDESNLDGQEIEVQETRYFYSVCTNEFASQRLLEKGRHDCAVFEGKTLFLDHENRLLSLLDSGCSNHIGVSTLVITADGKIPIGKQTKDSVGSPGRWAPTGSGSVDYRDLDRLKRDKNAKFHDLITYAMERETQEESNLQGEQMETHIVGYAKLLHRGGKPDFFGISFSEAHSGDLQIRGKEPLYMEDYVPHDVSSEDKLDLEAHLRNMQTWYENQKEMETSFILLLNLQFAADFLSRARTEQRQLDP